MRRATVHVTAAAVAVGIVSASSQGAPRAVSGNWTSFGRSADQTRNSRLTQITRANVGNRGRVFRIRYRVNGRMISLGQQSCQLAVYGSLYATTHDNNVFAINCPT